MAKSPALNKPFKMVKPTFEKGVRNFALLNCPEGHLIKFVRYGEWAEARKIKEIRCYKCGRENGAKPE